MSIRTMLQVPGRRLGGPRWWSYLEVVVVGSAPALLSIMWRPQDPFWTQGGFPWAVLVPLAVGVQHGLLPALASTALLGLGALLHASALGAASAAAWMGCWAGCLGVAALAGGFKQHALRAERAERERAEELKRRLQRSLRQQRVLALSHRRL